MIALGIVISTVSFADPPPAVVGDQLPRSEAACSSEVRREKVRFLDTGSICMEGASAHIAGRGCTTIRWKREDKGEYIFFCETQDTCDLTHTGTFVAFPSGIDMGQKYAAYTVFCVDNNYTLLYQPDRKPL
jgi:hypothetical protein